MLAWLWRTFVRWRNSQNQRKIIQIATDWWMQASEMEPQEVHTLEGLRNLARSSMRGLRQVKVIGTFEVEVPIEFTTTGPQGDPGVVQAVVAGSRISVDNSDPETLS